MRIKKSNGKIYGAEFTAAERKAIELEIGRQLAEYTKNHAREVDAMILWVLHESFGFGKKRLKEYYESFSKKMDGLEKRYLVSENVEKAWVCTEKLKKIGVNLEDWEREIG